MAITDCEKLRPECPCCNSESVSIIYWFGAWKNDKHGVRVRVLLSPGELRTIHCKCHACDHSWEEYVVGHAVED